MAEVVGNRLTYAFARIVALAILSFGVVLPLHDAAVASDSIGPIAAPVPIRAEPMIDQPAAPGPRGFTDAAAGVSFDPPPGWIREPAAALNPQSDPPDPAQELVRFQARLGDQSLYAFPVPITGALIRDAGAIITIGVARAAGDMLDLDVDPRTDRSDASSVGGFFLIDEERTYEGLHVFTRYFVARGNDHRLIARAVTAEDDWAAQGAMIRASIDSLRADANGPNAAAAPPPTPVETVRPGPAEPALAEPESTDPSLAVRQGILARAAAMLSTPYVWGGNTPGRGMDCSAYVSATWGVARYTTESIGWVSVPITKNDLRPGDAMNLTIGRDPQGYGHIRLFEAWANEAHTLVWVYEETPPRAVHRVIVYDDRYQPIRLAGLTNAGVAPLVPAPLSAPVREVAPARPRTVATPRPTVRVSTPRPTPRPTATRTPAPTVRATPRPTATLRPTPLPTATLRPTPLPTATPHR